MSSPNFNGRVDIMSPNTSILFSMQDKIPTQNKASAFKDAMTGNWYNTSLSDAFFSKENIQALQNGLRAGVMQKSNGQYLIGEQNTDQLKIIMRSIFLQYSNNLPNNIPLQIKKLNELVLDYAVGQVYGEAIGYMKYRYAASYMYEPLTTPVMSSVKKKELVYKPPF
jgi:hypothetical protein